ncbi:hypothetical protein [Trueperella sp. LYQ143]|uniref:hypothetical protein n=1 Tax=Trueperella sp. LYQ143 TaxID=3391059 RepID=UPI0039831D59
MNTIRLIADHAIPELPRVLSSIGYIEHAKIQQVKPECFLGMGRAESIIYSREGLYFVSQLRPPQRALYRLRICLTAWQVGESINKSRYLPVEHEEFPVERDSMSVPVEQPIDDACQQAEVIDEIPLSSSAITPPSAATPEYGELIGVEKVLANLQDRIRNKLRTAQEGRRL